MPRSPILAFVVCLLVVNATWGQLPASRGVTVEIDDFRYTFDLGGDEWSMQCRFRIDGSEWRTASTSGAGPERELLIPGTTVRVGDPGDRTLQWDHGDDVRELRY